MRQHTDLFMQHIKTFRCLNFCIVLKLHVFCFKSVHSVIWDIKAIETIMDLEKNNDVRNVRQEILKNSVIVVIYFAPIVIKHPHKFTAC